MRQIVIICFCFIAIFARNYESLGQSFDKESAIKKATWINFENALNEIAGLSSYGGNIKNSFENDFNKDYEGFVNKYMDINIVQKCVQNQDNGYVCSVLSKIKQDKLKRYLSKKTNSFSAMGKNRLRNIVISLIDNVSNETSKDFVTYLQSSIANSGNTLYLLKKGTPVGNKGNNCNAIRSQYEKYKKRGGSYGSALRAAKKKLEECEENRNIKYLFSLDKLEYKSSRDNYSNTYEGSLTYRILTLNSQTGRVDSAIKTNTVQSYANSEDMLKTKLFEKASIVASSEVTNNLLDYISNKNSTKIYSKLDSLKYNYTLVLVNITTDSEDRNRIRLVKDMIRKNGFKPIKNRSESSDYKQVYNFGSSKQLDLEDFMYDMYDMADSVGIKIDIADVGDDILEIQFK